MRNEKIMIPLLLLGIAGPVWFLCYLKPRNSEIPKLYDPAGEKIARFWRERSDYRIFLGVPLDEPNYWVQVHALENEKIILADGSTGSLKEATEFFVAYPDDSLLYHDEGNIPLPGWVTLDEPVGPSDQHLLRLSDLGGGRRFIRVTFGRSTSRPGHGDYYSTTLENTSSHPVRVLKFGGYQETSQGFQLSTTTGKFFTAENFKVWYGLGASEWIPPGRSATDHNNFGGRPCVWAYFCETDTGESFLAGEVLQ